MRRRIPLHALITTLFLILLLIVGGAIGGLGYTVSRDILKSSASTLSERVGRETLRQFSGLVGPAEMATRLLSRDKITLATSLEQRLAHVRFMHEALGRSSELTALYVGYANGDFFLLRRIADAAERKEFTAPEQAVFIVQSIDHPATGRRGRFIFLDAALATLRSDDRPDYAASYDPRSRDWYQAAAASEGQIITAPHVLFTTRRLGTTIAKRASEGGAVAGADISLRTFERALAEQKVTPGTQIVLTNPAAQVIGRDDDDQLFGRALDSRTRPLLQPLAESGIPVLARLAPLVQGMQGEVTQNLTLEVDRSLWHVTLSALQLEGPGTLVLITAIPDRELMAAAYALLRHAALVMAGVVALAIALTWAMARAVSRPLRKLAGEVNDVRHFEFSQPIDVESSILEVGELAQTIAVMKQTISRFLDLSQTVAAENDFDRLLPHLLTETIAAAAADAGILYLADDDRLLCAAGLLADGTVLPPEFPLPDAATGSPLLRRVLAARAACSAPLTVADITALGLAHTASVCRASHAVAVPLLNRKNSLVGAMVLLRRDETDAARLSFIAALSGSVAVSLETKELIRAQKQLFEAMIKLIAGAIDAKSPYTGGHCARVPEIAKRLARAACAQEQRPFSGFQLSDDQWEALHIAAWLHDCGKVTTPEYVVDKATKLETINDRIHEIRMRFEVVKRDARIDCLEAIAAGEPAAAANDRLAAELARIDDDFAFVASCNEGGEFMSADRQQRLRDIAARTWLRTLDDRIGIARDEALRKSRTPAPTLPVREPLLADKPEHRIERDAGDAIANAETMGIKMPPPVLRADHGELHNLTIAHGTLTDEERYKINEHSVQSLIMLSRLPFPKHLRQVPEIACGHHEKIDGSGYPRRLRGEQMSVLARLMAIADIFEALTAADRPYKKGKTLSEAIAIMAKMRDAQHIDAELFDLFLRSGVHLDYARSFMRPAQIDAVAIDDYLETASVR